MPIVARVSHVSQLCSHLYKWTAGSNLSQQTRIDIVDQQARDVDRQVLVATCGSRSGSMKNHVHHRCEGLMAHHFCDDMNVVL